MKGTPLRLLIVFVCTAGSAMILQSVFDSSDHRKAEKAVRGYTVNGRVLGAELEKKSPGGAWSTELTHTCRGVVRVSYGSPAAEYDFDYEIPSHTIHPGNQLGEQALAGLTAAPPAAAPIVDGGAPSD
ncbi:MAG TPA: hypothetical protein VFF06_30945 [Polyangia bacterium]|nr:hypothetical protein [Polyangia bacterium]